MSKNPNFKSNNNSNKEDNNNNNDINDNNANNAKILRKGYSVKKHIKYTKKVAFKGSL
jgi:hypothetical protein